MTKIDVQIIKNYVKHLLEFPRVMGKTLRVAYEIKKLIKYYEENEAKNHKKINEINDMLEAS